MTKSRKDGRKKSKESPPIKKVASPVKPLSQFFAEAGLDEIVIERIQASPREDVEF